MTRTYQKKKRAEREAETRRRIVEATVALHTSVGPARTTISAVADKAGVQRHTVYSHFPEEGMLFAACTSHWALLHPFPPAERWEAADPLERLALALRAVWAWYADVETDLELFLRDAELVPAVRADMTRYADRLTTIADQLAADLDGSSTVRAAVGHALAFETWRSLVRREGLTTAGAVDAMLALVERLRTITSVGQGEPGYAETIRAAREAAGKDLGELAAALDMSFESYRDIESYDDEITSVVSYSDAVTLADILELDLRRMFGADDTVLTFADLAAALTFDLEGGLGGTLVGASRDGQEMSPVESYGSCDVGKSIE